MKENSRVTTKRNRRSSKLLGVFMALVAMAALLMILAAKQVPHPEQAQPLGKKRAVTLVSIPGSPAKQITLTAKANERLGIETGTVKEEPIALTQMVSGLVVPPTENNPKPKQNRGPFGGFGGAGRVVRAPQPAAPQPAAPHPGEVWLRVALSPVEWQRLAKEKSVRYVPLSTRNGSEQGGVAQPSGMVPEEDVKRSMLWVYYVVPGTDHALALYRRMRIELPLNGSEERRKVIPYSAVYYDGQGEAWVYVNGTPLTFARERVDVDRIVGDVAVLNDGPSVGTSIVTVGAAMLYGAEIFGK